MRHGIEKSKIEFSMNKRNRHSPEEKTKAVLEVLREEQTLNEIAAKYGVHPSLLCRWKQEFLERAPDVFKTGPDESAKELKVQIQKTEELEKLVGQLTYEVDWLKKKSTEIIIKRVAKGGR